MPRNESDVYDSFEALRQRYRPAQVGVLFIGESRPANGSFFYNGDSRLFRYTEEAFSTVYHLFSNPDSFLTCFRDLNCYLVDLCPQPVNNLSKKERMCVRRAGKERLACAITDLQPRAVVVVMKGIKRLVVQALSQANLENIPFHTLSFPAQGHEREYVAELARAIEQLRNEALLASACSR